MYNFARMMVSVVIALLFSSTYADQKYDTNVDVVSRTALIFITVLFIGYVGCSSIIPVVLSERPAFYREQFSEIYDVKIYTLCATLVEIPYIIVCSALFVIPYFFIVGFDQGNVTEKFFFYWLFQTLFITSCVFLGSFLGSALPDELTCAVVVGLIINAFSLFGGFMIKYSDFPDFWVFMYWLNPLHYVMEGLVVTQFYGDHSMVSVIGGSTVETAQSFVSNFYEDWHYSARGYDVMALCLFIIAFRVGTYLCLEYVRHDKR
jgi:ABC-type multidrug transport system permease subunit